MFDPSGDLTCALVQLNLQMGASAGVHEHEDEARAMQN